MATQPVRIINVGRGPQIEGHRLTVMDVFYYVHRGHDFEFIHRAMPSLRRDEYDAAYAYIQEHYKELERWDDEIEERNRIGREKLIASGVYQELDTSVPLAVRIARMKVKLEEQKVQAHD